MRVPLPEYRAEQVRPPASRFTVELLERAIREAVSDVSAPVVEALGGGRVRWGDQLDVRQLRTGAERGEIAGYLAKYATKGTEQAGGLLHRIAADEVERAPVREHVRGYMRTAFQLDGSRPEWIGQRIHLDRGYRSLWTLPAMTVRSVDNGTSPGRNGRSGTSLHLVPDSSGIAGERGDSRTRSRRTSVAPDPA